MIRPILPALILMVIALVLGLSAYRGIIRGGARFYALEREAMLRRAGFTLIGSLLLFVLACSFLIYRQLELNTEGAEVAAEVTSAEEDDSTPNAATTPEIASQPPLETPVPTEIRPTATPTRPICRAYVQGTGGSGVYLRAEAGTGDDVATITTLAEDDVLTLLYSAPKTANGFTWFNVRTIFNEEGWVVEDYLDIQDRSCARDMNALNGEETADEETPP